MPFKSKRSPMALRADETAFLERLAALGRGKCRMDEITV
jgi:hypothetical protein